MTYRELIYLCLDELKMSTDDNYFTEDHFIIILNNVRAALLKQTYKDVKKEIPLSNYLNLVFTLEEANIDVMDSCDKGYYFKSNKKIPSVIPVDIPKVYLKAGNNKYLINKEVAYVTHNKLKYVGYSKWLSNILYASTGPDCYLYFKTNKKGSLEIGDKVMVSGIFEDIPSALELTEDYNEELLDNQFPIEESLVPQLIQTTVQQIAGSIYKPEDSMNNSSDDLSNLVSFLRNNMKSNMQKQIEE